MFESNLTGIAMPPIPDLDRLVRTGQICFYAISLRGIGTFEDEFTGEIKYFLKQGVSRRVKEEVVLNVKEHTPGPQGSAIVEISHTVRGNPKRREPDKPGYHDGEVYEMGPNTHISNLPPTGKKRHLVHGTFIKGKTAWLRERKR